MDRKLVTPRESLRRTLTQPVLYRKPLGARVTCLYNADNRRVRQEK